MIKLFEQIQEKYAHLKEADHPIDLLSDEG